VKLTRRDFLKGGAVTLAGLLVGLKPQRMLTTAAGHKVPITGDLVDGEFTAEAWIRADGLDIQHEGVLISKMGWTRVPNLTYFPDKMIELPLMLPHDAQDGDLHHCVWYWDDEGPIDGKWI